jgi:hypothetical protein
MAIRIKSYYKTTDLTEEQLAQAVKSCQTQDYQVYELYKTFGTLTPEDVWELYCELVFPIEKTSSGRSNNTLVRNGVIREIGNVTGSYGRPIKLYEIVKNPPSVLKSYNKNIPKTISLDLLFTDNGQIDVEKMVDNLDLVLSNISRKFDISY